MQKQLAVFGLTLILAVSGYVLATGLWSISPARAAEKQEHDHGDHSAHATGAATAPTTSSPSAVLASRRILYYRNPMGLADTSPTPKKDSMGMDYIPVYADEAMGEEKAVTIPLDRLQRSGFRSGKVAKRVVDRPVRAPAAIKVDERRVKVVALRMESFIEKLFVDTTGQTVREGQPLFRFVSQQLQQTEIDLIIGTRSSLSDGSQQAQGAIQRLRNLGMPESHIRDIIASRTLPRSHDWPAPAGGVVLEKRVLEGQRAAPGDELYRIADLSTVWAIADVAERDIGRLRLGDKAEIAIHAYPGEMREGRIAFVAPEIRTESRTIPVRVELPNTDGRLRLDMYAEAALYPVSESAPIVAVPTDAVIDSGRRQAAIVVLGEGRFEPRTVKVGRRGDGWLEIKEGLSEGDEIVLSANFLIDAESNLRAALRAFSAPETMK